MRKVAIVILVIFIVLGFLFLRSQKKLVKELEKIENNESFDVYKVIFKGDDGKEIYALLFAPKKERFDVAIVLPGAGGKKESRRRYAEILLEKGYGSLILDQRGIGETDGILNSLQQDFEAFLSGKYGHQFLMARDAVNAVDFLEDFDEVRKIAVIGESMGGRNAMIAAGLDKRIQGAVVIASAGYRGSLGSADGDRFLSSINPNSYIGMIAPRRLMMIHAVNDSVIPLEEARYTFSLAQEPKKFVEVGDCNHGYCEVMKVYIQEELDLIFR